MQKTESIRDFGVPKKSLKNIHIMFVVIKYFINFALDLGLI